MEASFVVSLPSAKKKLNLIACESCHKAKRKCDAISEEAACSRCVASGKECVKNRKTRFADKEWKRNRKKARDGEPSSPSGDSALSADKTEMKTVSSYPYARRVDQSRASASAPVLNQFLLEGMANSAFMGHLLSTFDRYGGIFFDFFSEMMLSDVKALYNTPQLQVRSDAMFALVCRGIGLKQYSDSFFERARDQASRLLGANSSEAMILLALNYFGRDTSQFQRTMQMTHAMVSQRDPMWAERDRAHGDYSTNSLFSQMNRIFGYFTSARSLKIFQNFNLELYRRIPVVAHHVRAAVRRHGVPDSLGPFDYCGFLGIDSPPLLTTEVAFERLQRIEDLMQQHRQVVASIPLTEQTNFFYQSLDMFADVQRAILLYLLGDLARCHQAAFSALKKIKTLRPTMMPVTTILDICHIVEISIQIRDPLLFDEAVEMMAFLGNTLPAAAAIAHSLRDIPTLHPWDAAASQRPFALGDVAALPLGGLLGTDSLFTSQIYGEALTEGELLHADLN